MLFPFLFLHSLGSQTMRLQFWVHAPAPDTQTLLQVGQPKVQKLERGSLMMVYPNTFFNPLYNYKTDVSISLMTLNPFLKQFLSSQRKRGDGMNHHPKPPPPKYMAVLIRESCRQQLIISWLMFADTRPVFTGIRKKFFWQAQI